METSTSTIPQTLTLRNDSGQTFKTFGQILNPGDEKTLGEFDVDNLKIRLEDVDSGEDLYVFDIHIQNKAKQKLVAEKDAEGKLTLKNADEQVADESYEGLEDDRGMLLGHHGTQSTLSDANQGVSDATPGATEESCATNPEARDMSAPCNVAASTEGPQSEKSEQASSSISKGSEESKEITIMNVASRRVLVNGILCEVGDLTSIGMFFPGVKHKLTVKDELDQEELFTQDVLVLTRAKHLVVLDVVEGGITFRKQNRSGMPYDGEIDKEEEEDFIAANEELPKSGETEQKEKSAPAETLSEGNTAAWQDPQTTSHATASGELGPSLTSEIEEPQYETTLPSEGQSSKMEEQHQGLKRRQAEGLEGQDQQSPQDEQTQQEGQLLQSTDLMETAKEQEASANDELPKADVGQTQMDEPTTAQSEGAPQTNNEGPATVISVLSEPMESSTAAKSEDANPPTETVIPLSTSAIIAESVNQLVGAGHPTSTETVSSAGSGQAEINAAEGKAKPEGAILHAVHMGQAAATTVLKAATMPLRAANNVLHAIVETAKDGLAAVPTEHASAMAEGTSGVVNSELNDTVKKDTELPEGHLQAIKEESSSGENLMPETAKESMASDDATLEKATESPAESAQPSMPATEDVSGTLKTDSTLSPPAAESRYDQSVQAAESMVESVKDMTAQTTERIMATASAVSEAAGAIAEGTKDTIKDIAESASSALKSSPGVAKENAQDTVDIANKKVQESVDAAKEMAGSMKDAAVTKLHDVVEKPANVTEAEGTEQPQSAETVPASTEVKVKVTADPVFNVIKLPRYK